MLCSKTTVIYQQQIKLDSAVNINGLVFALAKLLRLQRCVSHNRLDVLNATEVAEVIDMQVLGTSEQIRQVKVLNVVTSDDVRINFTYELSPTLYTTDALNHLLHTRFSHLIYLFSEII